MEEREADGNDGNQRSNQIVDCTDCLPKCCTRKSAGTLILNVVKNGLSKKKKNRQKKERVSHQTFLNESYCDRNR